jgi:hypothetical protein
VPPDAQAAKVERYDLKKCQLFGLSFVFLVFVAQRVLAIENCCNDPMPWMEWDELV